MSIHNYKSLSICAVTLNQLSWEDLIQVGCEINAACDRETTHVSLNHTGKYRKTWTLRTAMKRQVDIDDPQINFHYFDAASTNPGGPISENPSSFHYEKEKQDQQSIYFVGVTVKNPASLSNVETMVANIFECLARRFDDISGFANLFMEASTIGYSSAMVNSRPTEENKDLLEELEWYKRLRAPEVITLQHGRFRNVYRWNLLSSAQQKWLTVGRWFQKSPPGLLVELPNQHQMWTLSEEDRASAFEALKEVGMTHYRFFQSATGRL